MLLIIALLLITDVAAYILYTLPDNKSEEGLDI